MRRCIASPTCKSEDEIDKFIANTIFTTYYTSYDFNVNNFGDAGDIIEKSALLKEELLLSNGSWKSAEVQITKSQVTTSDSFFKLLSTE